MIKFCDPDAVESVIVDGVEFHLKQVNVRTKFEIITALSQLTENTLLDALDELKNQLSRVIVSVSYKDKVISFAEAFERFENSATINRLMTEIIRYCTLTEAQRKNSDSSPGQPTPESVGSAETPAEPDGEPASITPTPMESPPQEDKG